MEFITLRDGVELYYKKNLSNNPKGVLLITHGFAEHLGRYEYIADYFIKEGYSIYRYDLRAHGQSKSKLGDIDSFNDFIDDLDEMVELIIKENIGLPIFMLGHSMGGLITALYGTKHKNKIKGQIFSGAALGQLPSVKGIRKCFFLFANNLFKNIKIKNPVDESICSDREVYLSYLNDPLVLKKATMNFYVEFLIKSIRALEDEVKEYSYPCFITHGELDRIAPKELSISFYEKIASKDKELKIYTGLFHEILNEKEKDHILEDMVQWMDNRI